MGRSVEMIGLKFGLLKVIELHSMSGRKRVYRCQCDCGARCCQCDCGARFLDRGDSLRSGAAVSCGCLRARNAKAS